MTTPYLEELRHKAQLTPIESRDRKRGVRTTGDLLSLAIELSSLSKLGLDLARLSFLAPAKKT